MNLLNKLRHALLGKTQPKVTRLESPDGGGMRIDELPPFTLKTADLMRYDPQMRIGLGARNGLLMAAQVEVVGGGGTGRGRQGDRQFSHSPTHPLSHSHSTPDNAPTTVSGGENRVVHWVQHQWDALWHSAAHQLLRA